MADEAVTPAGERAGRRRGTDGWEGEWVRAVDAGDDERARWIEDDEPPRRGAAREPGAGQPPA
jgi:hypothetical protein